MRILNFYNTTIGKKVVVGATGAIMYGFILGHMLGNLKAFAGPSSLDHYAEMLREIGQDFVGYGNFLWVARIVLLISVALHVITVIQLIKRNTKGKPTRKVKRRNASTIAAKSMAVSGSLILVFIIIHIAQFTLGWFYPHANNTEGFVYGQVYSNLWGAFNLWWVTAFYILMMAMICMHVYHGAWSIFQTLGLDSPSRNKYLRLASMGTSSLLFIGFTSVPVLMLTNTLPSPKQETKSNATIPSYPELENKTGDANIFKKDTKSNSLQTDDGMFYYINDGAGSQ